MQSIIYEHIRHGTLANTLDLLHKAKMIKECLSRHAGATLEDYICSLQESAKHQIDNLDYFVPSRDLL